MYRFLIKLQLVEDQNVNIFTRQCSVKFSDLLQFTMFNEKEAYRIKFEKSLSISYLQVFQLKEYYKLMILINKTIKNISNFKI